MLHVRWLAGWQPVRPRARDTRLTNSLAVSTIHAMTRLGHLVGYERHSWCDSVHSLLDNGHHPFKTYTLIPSFSGLPFILLEPKWTADAAMYLAIFAASTA